jgi:ABC-type lipoprotein export system ATPase subunit
LSNTQNIYRIRDLGYSYRQNGTRKTNPIVTHQVLFDVNLDVDLGEFICISGPSGSGKSTLLNLMGFIENLQSGSIVYGGRGLQNLNAAEINRIRLFEIGFVFQDFQLLDVLTVEENVEYFVARQGHSKGVRQKIVQQALEDLGITDCATQTPRELSGGQKQRVAFARALAKRPKVIIADEPTANLDRSNTVKIIGMVKDLATTRGVTIVMASHDPLVIESAHRVIEVRDGTIARQRPGEISHAG